MQISDYQVDTYILYTEPGFGVFLKRLCPVQGVGFVHHYIKSYISIYVLNNLWKSRKVFFKIPYKISFPHIERGVIRCKMKGRPVWISSKLYSKRPAYFPPQHNPCSPPNDPPEENNPFYFHATSYHYLLSLRLFQIQIKSNQIYIHCMT